MTIPDVDITRIREDFLAIWEKNVSTAVLIRKDDPDAGNYGSIGNDSGVTRRTISLNVQGLTSGSYERKAYGLDTTGSIWHVYALYTEDIRNTDRIEYANMVFTIANLNNSIKDGQTGFIEFDIVSEVLNEG